MPRSPTPATSPAVDLPVRSHDVRQVARGWRWGRRSMVPRSAEQYVEERETAVFPTGWSRRAPAKAVREVAQKGALEPLFRSQVRPYVEGLDVLTRVQGPVIFVANHASHLDTPLILLSLPDEWRRRTAVAAAADYFFDTWWRAVGSAVLFNTFPIERRGGSMAATPGQVLAEGWNLVVYPGGDPLPGRLARAVPDGRRLAGGRAARCRSSRSRIAARSPRCRAVRAGRARGAVR